VTRREHDPNSYPTSERMQREMDQLALSDDLDCERILSAADMAMMGHVAMEDGWDRLLSQAATYAMMRGCVESAAGWFDALAQDAADPVTRANALAWLAALGESAAISDLEASLKKYDEALAALQGAGDGARARDVLLSVLNRKANVLSRMNKPEQAVSVHAQAMEVLRTITGGSTSHDRMLMLNQARLESEAGNPKAACDLYDRVLLHEPNTVSEIEDYLGTAIIRYQTGRRTDDPDGGIAALEAAWENPAFHGTYRIVDVGWQLVEAMRYVPGRSRARCDLAANLIERINSRREEWIREAEARAVVREIPLVLRRIQLSCASVLQSATLHGSREHLDLAYRTILDLEPDPAQRERHLESWAGAIQRLETFLASGEATP